MSAVCQTHSKTHHSAIRNTGSGSGKAEGGDDDEPVPAELVELDNTLAADVAAAVAKAAAESGSASMENSEASGDSPPPSGAGCTYCLSACE
jgi:hypothetical protein